MSHLYKIINFTHSKTKIKIQAVDTVYPDFCMWPHVGIVQGTLLVAPEADAGDILHELGHIATTPPELRPSMCGELGTYWEAVTYNFLETHPDQSRTISCDSAATYWGFWAAHELGIQKELLFKRGYESDESKVWGSGHAGFELFKSCMLCFHTKTENHVSVAAYYAGLTRNKKFLPLTRWEVD